MAAVVLAFSGCDNAPKPSEPEETEYHYAASEEAFYNPLMGFSASASDPQTVADNTLVYVEVLWKDIEPQEGVFDFSVLEKVNNLSLWRAEGKHAVVRFICDKPTREPHMDIPQWLYDKTGGGTFYQYDSSHAGYSPDYADPVFIAAHEKAIAALGAYFGNDTFVSYVELGSLGHWGEWHVNYDAGIVRLPAESVREQYVVPYLSAFPNAKLLMRRPFNTAKKYGLGLYDDMAGSPESTGSWLDWIQNGGDYAQAREKDALSPMPDAWQAAPVGGEFNSDLEMTDMLTTGLETTLSLLRQSHTTFLGPNFPTGDSSLGIDSVRKTMGYRLRVESAQREGQALTLIWKNDGIAPMYWDWPVYLYFYDAEGLLLGKLPVGLKTTQILPGSSVCSITQLPEINMVKNSKTVCVGIEDPMTGLSAVYLAMDTDRIGCTSVLWG